MNGFKSFFSRWQNRIALIVLAAYFLVALAAPLLAPPADESPQPGFRIAEDPKGYLPQPPSETARLGTVPTGTLARQIDVYYTLVWGTRAALQFGLTVALITAAFGVVVGAFSAYVGGTVNNLMMRVTDAFLAFPVIVAVVFIQQLFLLSVEASGGFVFSTGEVGWVEHTTFLYNLLVKVDPVMLAIILFSWMITARLTNTEVMRVKQSEYIFASRAIGAKPSRIIFRHLIPNSTAPAIIILTRDIGGVVLLQAALTFIGMGGESLWGELLVLGRRWIFGPDGNLLTYWWTYIPATLAIVLFGIGWSLLGDGLNDFLNPRSKQHIEL